MSITSATFFGERYEQPILIGSGGEASIYKVFDRALGCYVALKAITIGGDDDLAALKREFRTLADVRHRGIVAFHELHAEHERACFTMELVDGLPLDAFVDPSAAPETRVARTLEALPQIVSPLLALHERGLVHGDLKPANIMVRVDGQVKLVDFGLTAHGSAIGRGPWSGTPAFMSPEQANDLPLVPASDWYSLGATLYYVLSGQLPFSRVHLFDRPAPPRVDRHVPAVPEWLALLVEAMLDPDVAGRPGDDELRELVTGGRARQPEPVAIEGRHLERPGLAARLSDARSEARRRQPHAALVRGPSGVGKTSLVRAFTAAAAADGTLVLSGRCHYAEAIPFGAIDAVLDVLAGHIGDLAPAALARVAPATLDDVLAVFPVLRRVPAWRAVAMDEVGVAEERRRRAFEGLAELLAALDDVIVWIDDVHWCDLDSVRLLGTLVNHPRGPGPLLILGMRSEPLYEGLTHELMRHIGSHRLSVIDVPILSRDELATWLATWPVAFTPEVVERLGAEAVGLPLFACDLARHVARGGELTSWRALLDERVAALAPTSRVLLEILGAAEHPLRLDDLFALAPIERADAAVALRDLLTAHLVAPSPEQPPRVQIQHQRVVDGLRDITPPERQRQLHRLIAEQLATRLDVHPGVIVEHLRAAGEADAEATRVLLAAAAQRAEAHLAFDQAARYREAALDADPARDIERVIACADALAVAGRCERAAGLYDEAARRADDPRRAAEWNRHAAEQWLRAGDTRHGVPRLRAALEAQGVRFPRSMIGALAGVLWGRLVVNLAGTRFRPRATPEPQRLARVDACWAATLGLNHLDILRSAAFQSRHLRLALSAGEPARAVRGLATELVYRVAEGASLDAPRVRRLQAQSEGLARDAGDGRVMGFHRLCVGAAEVFAGRWGAAIATLEDARALLVANQGSGTWEAWNCVMYRAWARTHLGDFEPLEGELVPAIADARARGDHSARVALASGRCNLAWIVAGRADEAAERAREAMAPFPATPFQTPHYFDLLARVNLLLLAGEGAAAHALARRGWGELRRIFFLRMRYFRIEARWLVARAALGAAAGSREASARAALVREARREAGRLAREGEAYAVGYARLLAAGCARVEGRDASGDAAAARDVFAVTGQRQLHAVAVALIEDSVGDRASDALYVPVSAGR